MLFFTVSLKFKILKINRANSKLYCFCSGTVLKKNRRMD
jgi:hypothetical protein